MIESFKKIISNHTWLRVSDGVISAGSTATYDERGVLFNDRYYLYDNITYHCQTLDAELCGQIKPQFKTFCARAEGWQSDYFAIFNPLIYTTAFGKRELFDMASCLIHSIESFSGINYTTALITRVEDSDIIKSTFGRPGVRFDRIARIEANNVEDFTFARYRAIFECSGIEWDLYSPVIYVDSDIICDNNIEALCKRLIMSRGVSVLPEGRALDEAGWFGKTLVESDPTVVIGPDDHGYNSGVIAATDATTLRPFFQEILNVYKNIIHYDRSLLDFFDQPILNYVGRKMNCLNVTILPAHLKLVGHAYRVDPDKRVGFAHFAGGVGNANPKLSRMQEYVASLPPPR